MKKKLIFFLIAAFFLAPWPVAHAYDDVQGHGDAMQVEPAAPATTPHLKAFGNAVGSVTPGDLFFIETANTSADIPVTLHITNVDDLVHAYRYMNLNIGIYAEKDSGQWEKISTGEEGALPNTYITMHSGVASFTLPGYSRYKITIDRGCFYRYGTNVGAEAVLPAFFLSLG